MTQHVTDFPCRWAGVGGRCTSTIEREGKLQMQEGAALVEVLPLRDITKVLDNVERGSSSVWNKASRILVLFHYRQHVLALIMT